MAGTTTTLLVSHNAPYPPRSGSPLRCWQNINVLATLGPVHVFSVGLKEPDATMPIAASWTHIDAADIPNASSGIVPRILRALRPRQFPLENDFITRRLNDQLAKIIDRVHPDVIVLSQWHNALPDALRRRHVLIVDTHNIESSLARELWKKDGRLTLRRRYQLWQWQRRERELLRLADRIWVTSDDDAREVRKLDEKLPTPIVWPNTLDVSSYASVYRARLHAVSAPSGTATVGYVGYYAYEPNARAALTLARSVLPIVAERMAEAKLLLIGKDPTDEMLALARSNERIRVTGSVADVRDMLRLIDVLVVPLTEGGGTRLKILEAFASGIPVISTSKGAQGLDVISGVHIEICDDLTALGTACLALLSDRKRLQRQIAAAYSLVSNRYSWESLVARLPDAV